MKDFEGVSSLDHARARKHEEIVKIIEKQDEDKFEEIRTLIRKESFEEALFKIYKKEHSLKKTYYLASIYDALDNFTPAQYYYEKGLEEDPQFAFYLANLHRKLGDEKAALNSFDLGFAQSHSDYFKYHKSNYLRELGHHEEAIKVMNDLLKEDPNRVDYMFHKANSLRTLGLHEEAYQEMKKADKLMPQNELFKEHAEQSVSLIKGKEENHVSDS